MSRREEFEETAVPHLDAVYRAAVALAGRQMAEELVQRTFLKGLERFDTFRRGTNCRAWLLQILRNTWFDELRHRKVVGPTAQVEELPLAASEATAEETEWTDADDLLQNFSDEQVIEAMEELSAEQRLTLFLTDVEEMDQQTIAEIMGVAVGTIKSRASRAREALRHRLEAHARDLGFLGRRS